MKYVEKILAPATLTIWALQAATPVIASYFPAFPNHIRLFLAFATVILAAAVVLIRRLHVRWGTLAALCGIPAAYGASLIVASYYGVNFNYSVRHLLLAVPVFAILEFAGWFLVGVTFKFRHVVVAQVLVGTVLASHMLWLLASGAGGSRLLNGLEFAGGVSAGGVSGFWPVGLLLLVLTFFSMKKIAIAAAAAGAIVSVATSLWLRNHRPVAGPLVVFAIMVVVAAPAGVEVATPAGIQQASATLSTAGSGGGAFGPVERTVSRFAESDPTREFIDEYSTQLLAQNFPRGIGYFGFELLSADKISYTTYTSDNEPQAGVSLHNTYMFFLLEGGVITTFIILVAYGAAAITLWQLTRHVGTRGWAAFLLGWVAACMVYAYAHQLHETPYLFGLLGLTFGVRQLVTRDRDYNKPGTGNRSGCT